jgi:hypothetical protein
LRLLRPEEEIKTRFDVVEVYLLPQTPPEVCWHRGAFTFAENATRFHNGR